MERRQHRPGLPRRPLGYPKGKQKNKTTNLTCSRQRVRVLLPHFSLPPSLPSTASLTWPQWYGNLMGSKSGYVPLQPVPW